MAMHALCSANISIGIFSVLFCLFLFLRKFGQVCDIAVKTSLRVFIAPIHVVLVSKAIFLKSYGTFRKCRLRVRPEAG